jgi:hypothetical protein
MFFETSEESSKTETQDFAPDSRVSSALDALDIPYECDPSTGRFEVLVQLKNGRSQTVFIHSATNKFLGIELREISSPAMVSDAPSTPARPISSFATTRDFSMATGPST